MKFEDNCWAYRDVGNDSNISEIPKIIRNAITMVVCEILKSKQEGISHTSNEFLVLLERISNMQKTMFKDNVMRVETTILYIIDYLCVPNLKFIKLISRTYSAAYCV
jgi:hypothetical protein